MKPRTLDYHAARRNLKEAPNARWPSIASEFSGWIWPEITPSFRLKSDDTIFTIGSCFARNVEEHLARLGCRVPMLDLYLPPHEWRGAPNSAMNKFNPPAFTQVLEWAGKVYDRDKRVSWDDCAPFAFDCGDDAFFDLDMGATPPVTRERFIERRQHIFDIFSSVFTADCLAMTPGLIEAWRDKETGLYTHEGPMQKAVLQQAPRRFELQVLSYQQCEDAMLRAVDAVRSRNPSIKILITTSPVPLSATFSGQDVRIANTYSKSVLRAVCGSLTQQRELVDYFPSFESVMLSHPDDVWQQDRIHVAYGFVGRIVEHLVSSYFEDADEASRLFQGAVTAIANKETAKAADALRQALALRPSFPQAQALLADTLTSMGQYDQAAVDLRALIERRPDDADLRLKLARAQLHLSQKAEAFTTIEAALELSSTTLTQFQNGIRMLAAAPLEQRERVMRAAVDAFPLYAPIYEPLAEVLVAQGRKEEAIDLLARATVLHKPPAEVYALLAKLLLEAGRAEEARAQIVALKFLSPKHPDLAGLEASAEAA
jgi:tetratricopeptide (TPR) repeat protein